MKIYAVYRYNSSAVLEVWDFEEEKWVSFDDVSDFRHILSYTSFAFPDAWESWVFSYECEEKCLSLIHLKENLRQDFHRQVNQLLSDYADVLSCER